MLWGVAYAENRHEVEAPKPRTFVTPGFSVKFVFLYSEIESGILLRLFVLRNGYFPLNVVKTK